MRESAYRATGMYHYDVQSMAGVLMHHGLVAEMYTGEEKLLLPHYLLISMRSPGMATML